MAAIGQFVLQFSNPRLTWEDLEFLRSRTTLPAIVDTVLLGRPYLWGLAAGGEAGVLAVLRGTLADLDLTIALSGHTRPSELDPGMLARVSS